MEPPPSPRRGSKRSLLSRSRQGSRSSRRSARHAAKTQDARDPPPPLPQNDGQSSQKKAKSGFLSFLNCCSRDDDTAVYKSEEPDVPAKQRRIEPTSQPQRTVVPDEPTETINTEKPNNAEPTYNEKIAEPVTVSEEIPATSEKPKESSRPKTTRNEISHEKPSGSAASVPSPVSIPVITTTPSPDTREDDVERRNSPPTAATTSLIYDAVTIPESEIAQSESKPQLEFPPPPRDEERDVIMNEAPAVPPVEDQDRLDEPEQPNDVKPVVLPPPPPLQKRIQQTQTSDIPPVPEPEPEKQQWLLPPVQSQFKGRKCLILDLDETLVHSSFKILNQADFTIPVEIEGQYHNVYVIKRPGVDQFMKRVGELYEVVVFTASVSKYGDPLLDQLDIHHVVHHRLFRESCYNHQGNYVKVSKC